jgi:hypothetical protein
MKPPVLIICFRRPRNLDLIVRACNDKSRDIYIFVDKCQDYDELNIEVSRMANQLSKSAQRIKVKVGEKNLGVRFAVPAAINWALESCENLIVLEDDCLPNQYALDYFDESIKMINHETVLASGSTLPNFPEKLSGYNYESAYPLIWGWALTKNSWAKIRPDQDIAFKEIFQSILKYPNKAISILYFYAAVIRVDRGLLNAWDSPVALRMLIKNYKSIIPDSSVISNVGQDDVASHFESISTKPEFTVTNYGNRAPSMTKNLSKNLSRELDKEIQNQIYKMKFRHILSPIKSKITQTFAG